MCDDDDRVDDKNKLWRSSELIYMIDREEQQKYKAGEVG